MGLFVVVGVLSWYPAFRSRGAVPGIDGPRRGGVMIASLWPWFVQASPCGLFVVVGVLSWHPAFRARGAVPGIDAPGVVCDDRPLVDVVRPGFTL